VNGRVRMPLLEIHQREQEILEYLSGELVNNP
jgi:hypothetical protein